MGERIVFCEPDTTVSTGVDNCGRSRNSRWVVRWERLLKPATASQEGLSMRRSFVALVTSVFCLGLSAQAFSQSSNASLSGTVSDAANALIPGVTITATNTDTGVVTTAVTNETGTYNVPSLLPGVYKV